MYRLHRLWSCPLQCRLRENYQYRYLQSACHYHRRQRVL